MHTARRRRCAGVRRAARSGRNAARTLPLAVTQRAIPHTLCNSSTNAPVQRRRSPAISGQSGSSGQTCRQSSPPQPRLRQEQQHTRQPSKYRERNATRKRQTARETTSGEHERRRTRTQKKKEKKILEAASAQSTRTVFVVERRLRTDVHRRQQQHQQ